MRNLFRIKMFLSILMLGGLVTAYGQQKITGSYTMFQNGANVSQEKFSLTTNADGSLEAEGDLKSSSIGMHIVTKATKTAPKSFNASIGNQGGISVTFRDGMVAIAITNQPERQMKTQASVVLENGVWHQLIFLLKQYDATRGGSQAFTALLPSQSREINFKLERLDTQTLLVNGAEIKPDHFKATTNEGLTIELWADADRIPMLISVPSQNIRVVREGSEGLAEAVFGKASARAEVADFSTEEVTFSNGDLKLAGTLTLPKTGKMPFAAALIITESGLQDRDGLTFFSIYRFIAESLSNAGIAVLRVDDRGVGKSAMPDPKHPTSYRDLINDSRAALDFLMKRNDIDKTRIALIGHGEGAETALTIASEDHSVAAIGLLAAPAHPVNELAVEASFHQLALKQTIDPGDYSKLPAETQLIIGQFIRARDEKPPTTGPDALAWFREHLKSDPSVLAKTVKCPVLLLSGDHDLSVPPHNGLELAQALIAGGNKRVSLRIFPNLNHFFMAASADKVAPPDQAGAISPEMLQTLSEWAVSTLKR